MKVEIRIDPACTEPRVIVVTDQMSEEVNRLVKRLSEETPQLITGVRGDMLRVLNQADILRVYATNARVYAQTGDGEYLLRMRLYEIEERLDRHSFVRISNSEIINLRRVKGFDLNYAGTICVSLEGGTTAYVSRRYVKRIKQVLGI